MSRCLRKVLQILRKSLALRVCFAKLGHAMSQLLRSSGAMGLATALSRVLGLVRELVYAHFMGDTPVASAFKFAFQIPNLFRRLLGEGALTAAFVPIFKAKERTEGEAAMWEAANATMSAVLVVTGLLTILVEIGISVVLRLSHVIYLQDGTPVFPPWPIPILSEETRLMLSLLRVTFPYLILVCLAALCMGMLNARHYFFLPALGATLLNVVMITIVLFVAPYWGETLEEQIFALAFGVLVAGVFQFGFQVPVLWWQGWRPRWISPWRHPVVREVAKKMVPGMIGVAAYQLNVLVVQSVAFTVDRHIVASFDYAVRLMEFPQGVIGISIATYLLTALSGLAAEKEYNEFRSMVREGVGLLFFLNTLAAALFFTLAEPLVRLLFERGAFTAESTIRVSQALAALAPGLVAFSLVNIYARAFYALGDTMTPMRISAFCLGVNLILSIWLIGPFRQVGMGVANTITSILNAALLLRYLRRKLKHLDMRELHQPVQWILGAGFLAGAAAWMMYRLLEVHLGIHGLGVRLLELVVPGLCGMGVYLFVVWIGKVPQLEMFRAFIYSFWRRGGK